MIAMLLAPVADMTYKVVMPTARDFVEGARHVLFVLDGDYERGTQPGGFTTDLIVLMSRADSENRAKLVRIFPALTACVEIYKTQAEGLDTLRGIAVLDW